MNRATWRPGVTQSDGWVLDRATGLTYALAPGSTDLTPARALRYDSGLEATVHVRASFYRRWQAYIRAVASMDWKNLRRVMSIFAYRRQVASPMQAWLYSFWMSTPLTLATTAIMVIVFGPIFVASHGSLLVVAGCMVLVLQVFVSSAIHEFAHALAALKGAPSCPVFLERRGMTLSVLVSPANGWKGITYAAAGPLAGALSCAPTAVTLQSSGIGLIPYVVALVHLTNLTAAAPDGRFLRRAARGAHRPDRQLVLASRATNTSELERILFGRSQPTP